MSLTSKVDKLFSRTSPNNLQVIKRASQKVWASPSHRRMDQNKSETEEMTFPFVCFSVDDHEAAWSDIIVRWLFVTQIFNSSSTILSSIAVANVNIGYRIPPFSSPQNETYLESNLQSDAACSFILVYKHLTLSTIRTIHSPSSR